MDQADSRQIGTTGLPKGVMVTQRSIAAYVQSCGELPFNTNARLNSRILLIFSVAFDGMLMCDVMFCQTYKLTYLSMYCNIIQCNL